MKTQTLAALAACCLLLIAAGDGLTAPGNTSSQTAESSASWATDPSSVAPPARRPWTWPALPGRPSPLPAPPRVHPSPEFGPYRPPGFPGYGRVPPLQPSPRPEPPWVSPAPQPVPDPQPGLPRRGPMPPPSRIFPPSPFPLPVLPPAGRLGPVPPLPPRRDPGVIIIDDPKSYPAHPPVYRTLPVR